MSAAPFPSLCAPDIEPPAEIEQNSKAPSYGGLSCPVRSVEEDQYIEGGGFSGHPYPWQKRVLETRLTPTLEIRPHIMNHRIYIISGGHRALEYHQMMASVGKRRLTGIVGKAVHGFWR